jgi:glyoxylase-like metal-dependent hydrolase (beta-lactamase superfamily II)
MKIVPISIPTPFYVGSVNVYLIKEDPLTLIDVGPKTEEAAVVLREKLAHQGIRMADIERIVLTHAHEDHCGLAKMVRDEAKNAEIYVHGWETGHLFGRLAQEEHRQIMFRAGVPDGVFKEMQTAYEDVSLLTDSLADGEFLGLTDEMELEFETGSLQVMHTPGHTPGSCTFVRMADRTVICGDCVLKRITPNPIVSPDPTDRSQRFKSLAKYLESLEKIRRLSPTMVYGGHGEPISDYEEIFHRYMKSIEERQRKVIGLVGVQGSTAYEIARQLFPDAQGDDVHRFLSISESIAHLDFAESQGRVGVEAIDGVEIYRK